MTIFDRFHIKVVASAGLCAAAIALTPDAAAAPRITGGYGCTQGSTGEAGLQAAAGGTLAAAGGTLPATGGPLPTAVCTASAPLTDMVGVPLVAPGPAVAPVGAPVPVGAPLVALGPAGAPMPVGAPVGAPVPVGAPLVALGPAGAPVPVGAPVGAPVPVGAPLPAGAPLIDMSGSYGGKGAPTGSVLAGGPVPGQPVLPGPSAAPPAAGAR